MAEYIGLKQIAERLKCSIPTVRRMHREEGLLLFRQRLHSRYGRHGWAWATDDSLLTVWLLSRCKADRAFIPPERPKATSQVVGPGHQEPRG